MLFASLCVILGVIWDISWHRSIGRDTFWTPAHLAIYLGGIVAGLTSGWVALTTTFRWLGEAARGAAGSRFWGFRAPARRLGLHLGRVSRWSPRRRSTTEVRHNAYGLDVKIISPPHMLLAAGIAAIQCGAMVMALAGQNRAVGDRRHLGRLLAAGLLLLLVATVATEHTNAGTCLVHFYQVTTAVFLFFLVSASRASIARWPATTVALVYTVLMLFMLILMPLFPAQPLLGPIYVQVDHFMPTDFPLLLLAPAVALDLVMQRVREARERLGARRDRGEVVFVVVFLAVQWPFADFLMTPAARNAFFVSHRMPYSIDPVMQARWYVVRPADNLATGLPRRAGAWLRVGTLRVGAGVTGWPGSSDDPSTRLGAGPMARPGLRDHSGARLDGARRQRRHVFRRQSRTVRRPRPACDCPARDRAGAQVAVRVLGTTKPSEQHVAIRAGQWNVGLKGAPPPEPAAPVPGDPELYAAELWFMTASSYQMSVDGGRAPAGPGNGPRSGDGAGDGGRPMSPWLGGVARRARCLPDRGFSADDHRELPSARSVRRRGQARRGAPASRRGQHRDHGRSARRRSRVWGGNALVERGGVRAAAARCCARPFNEMPAAIAPG